MRISVLFIIVLSVCSAAFGQQARVRKYTTAKCGTVVLKDVQDKYNAHIYGMELPDPDAEADKVKLEKIKAQIPSRYPRGRGAAARSTSSVLPPIVSLSYMADSLPGIPPDNYTAISNGNKTVCVMNDYISVHDATTGNMLYRKTLESFSSAVGLNSPFHDYRYDPKVVYDPQADRFIVIMLNATNQYNYIVLAFSKTNDPAGAWSFYKFYGDYAADTTWFDYPAISVTKNEVFFTGNKIKYDSSWQAGFTESVIYQIRKEDGYNGDTALTYQLWDSVTYDNNRLRCLFPLNPGDSLQGPGQYFLSNRDFDPANDSVFLVNIPDTVGGSDSLLTVVPVTAALSYGVPPDARQPDTSLSLATNDNRILGGFIAGNQIQFVNTTVDPGTGGSAVYHGVINNFRTAPAMTAQIFAIDTLDMGYPNISYIGNVGGSNQSIISFDYSGPNTYPGYGAIFYDGTGYSPMQIIRGGDSTISILTSKEQRWGDYSGSQPQWNAPGTVWVEGIYGRKNRNYGNYAAKLSSPYNSAVPVIATTSVSKIYPNPSWQYINYEFTITTDQMVSFVICDAQGRMVDKLIDNFCNAGKNVLQFNVGGLAPGTYFLKATSSNSENIPVHTFVRR
jgi:hypothetical protein